MIWPFKKKKEPVIIQTSLQRTVWFERKHDEVHVSYPETKPVWYVGIMYSIGQMNINLTYSKEDFFKLCDCFMEYKNDILEREKDDKGKTKEGER